MTTTKAAELGLPEWGTNEALLWGVAHPDNPHISPETRAEYAYPDGSWWRQRFPDGVPSPAECTAPAISWWRQNP